MTAVESIAESIETNGGCSPPHQKTLLRTFLLAKLAPEPAMAGFWPKEMNVLLWTIQEADAMIRHEALPEIGAVASPIERCQRRTLPPDSERFATPAPW